MISEKCMDCKHKGRISGRETCRLLLREIPDSSDLPGWCPQREIKEKKKYNDEGGTFYD